MKIIVDAMGGDLAPAAPLEGSLAANRLYGCEVILVGRQEELQKALEVQGHTRLPEGVEIVNATEIVEMCDDPTMVCRRKRDSSLTVGLNLLRDGGGDALVSAGSTGALLAGATLIVKRIKGVKRAAVAPVIPVGARGCILIDAGANSECTPEYMVQFAHMGACCARTLLGTENPRVGLLNIGSESSKGTPLYQQVYGLLSAVGETGTLNFIGNVEGREAAEGKADVIVADGFTGNIFLKTLEGTASYMSSRMKQMFLKSAKTKVAALLLKDGIADFKRAMDYRETGGTALLGITRPVIKAHGSSDAYAFQNAIRQASQAAESGLSEAIAQAVQL